MATGPTFDELIANLRRMLPTIITDTMVLAHHRDVFRGILAMLEGHPDLPESSVVYGYLQRTYFASASTAVRRLTDDNPRSISLYLLIDDIRVRRNILTRNAFLSLHQQLSPDELNQIFDEFAQPGDQLMAPEIIRRDQKLLLGQAHTVREFVDKEVAHSDRQHILGPLQRPGLATYGELDTAIDAIQKILRKYQRLLTGIAPEDYTPQIDEDWKKLFRVSWMRH